MRYLVAMLLVLAAGCDAMNLSQLRQALVEQSGQRGLVTDAGAGDYTDKSGLVTNATYYINAGLRWLNQLWQHAATRRRVSVALAEGEWSVNVPNVENINRIDYLDEDGKRRRLQYKDIGWLRDYYDEEFGEVDEAAPLYWAWAGESRDGESSIVDPNFALGEGVYADSMPDPAGKWSELGTKWSISGGVATGTMTADPNPIYEDIIYNTQPIDAIFPNVGRPSSVAVDVTVSGYSGAFAGFYILVGWRGDMPDGSGVGEYSAGLGYALLPEYQAGYPVASRPLSVGTEIRLVIDGLQWPEPYYNLNWIQVVPLICSNEADAEIRISSVNLYTEFVDSRLGNVIVMPPADADYTLDVFGKFKTTDLSASTDTNWWTDNYPEYVIRAARLMLELDGHRNVSGMDAFEARIKTDIERLLANDRFAFIAGLTPQEAVLNG